MGTYQEFNHLLSYGFVGSVVLYCFMDHMTVDFYVFGALVENWVLCNMDGKFVIAVNGDWFAMLNSKVLK